LAPELIHQAWATRQRIYRSHKAPALLANSRWNHGIAAQSLAAMDRNLPALPHTAPPVAMRYGIPTDEFRPRDQAACREMFDLPADRFLILFSASAVTDRRKGVADLVDALKRLSLPDVTAVCVGHYSDADRPDLPDLRVMGYINDTARLAMLYSAVDLFVGPSLEEALGQVYLEAAACGTPAVAYPVGGVPEAICDGITGRLAAAVGPGALADAIAEMYEDDELRRRMSRCAPIYVQNEWSLYAAAHQMHVAMHITGLADRLKLGRKISFPPGRPPMRPMDYVRPAAGWRAVSGFGPWEGPYPQWKLSRCRWLNGPTCQMELAAPQPGRYRLMIRAHGAPPGQRVQLLLDGQPHDELDVPPIPEGHELILGWTLELPRGASPCELRFWKWDPPQKSPRPMALLVSQIELMRWT
jgi:hypothetical protein